MVGAPAGCEVDWFRPSKEGTRICTGKKELTLLHETMSLIGNMDEETMRIRTGKIS